jgi:hypothetical protein
VIKFLIEMGLFFGLIGSIFAYGYHVGFDSRDRTAAKDVIAAQVASDKVRDAYQSMAATALNTSTNQTDAIHSQTAFLRGAVHAFVTPVADSKCIVSAGFVRGVDAAIGDSPASAPAPGELVDADSGITLSAVAENDIFNTGVAKSALVEVKAWRSWYHNLWAMYGKPDPWERAADAN